MNQNFIDVLCAMYDEHFVKCLVQVCNLNLVELTIFDFQLYAP